MKRNPRLAVILANQEVDEMENEYGIKFLPNGHIWDEVDSVQYSSIDTWWDAYNETTISEPTFVAIKRTRSEFDID